jgi:hypothetical protein
VQDLAHALAERLTTGSSVELVWPTVSTKAHIEVTPTFEGLRLSGAPNECPVGTLCAEQLSVSKEGLLRSFGRSATVAPEALAAFAEAAIDGDVITALMQDRPCAEEANATETLTLGIGSGLELHAEIAGCTEGPIANLRATVRALVDRHTDEP